MMRLRHALAACLGGLVLLGMGASPAKAGFTVLLGGESPSGANTQFNYAGTIALGDSITTGNFFRIYDFANLVPNSVTAPAGWTVTTSLTNPTPPPNVILSHGDDPTLANLTFTYTGVTPILGGTSLSGFSAISTTGATTTKDFVARVTAATGPDAGSFVDSVGNIAVPANAIPEPASVLSAGIGLILLGAGYAWRRRSTLTA